MADKDLVPETEATDEKLSADDTAGATSSTEENDQQAEVTGDQVTDEKVDESKYVPYDRFNEVIRERNELKARLEQKPEPNVPVNETFDPNIEAVKSQLKALGFLDKTEVERVLKQRDEDAQVQRQLESLEGKYDGKDGRPKFNREKVLQYAIDKQILDLETAYKTLNETQLIDWHIKNATTRPASLKTETSDGTGASNVGTTDDDLRNAVNKGDRTALTAFLKRRIREAQKS